MMSSLAATKKNFVATILFSSLLVAILDITAAVLTYYIINGRIPFRIFQYIASAAVGPGAFSGGVGMNLLGAFFHFFIALVFTSVFFILYSKLPILSKNKFLAGLLYGILIWMIMNLVVLPLTLLPTTAFYFSQVVIGIITLMVCVGLPISVIAHRYYKRD